jgi:hypothetical protein
LAGLGVGVRQSSLIILSRAPVCFYPFEFEKSKREFENFLLGFVIRIRNITHRSKRNLNSFQTAKRNCESIAPHIKLKRRIAIIQQPYFLCLRAGQNSGRGTVFAYVFEKSNLEKSIFEKSIFEKSHFEKQSI